MSVQSLADIVVGLALVGLLAYRQMTWRALDPARIWRFPLVAAVIGVVLLSRSALVVTPLDVLFLGVQALLATGVGLATGFLTVFRTSDVADARGRTLQTRTGWLGGALWLVLVVGRVGLDLLGTSMGAALLSSTGTVLLVLAVNRAARALVIDHRIATGPRAMMVR